MPENYTLMHLFRDEEAGKTVLGPSDTLKISLWKRERS
jgi:hypothetical protein